MNQWDFQYSHLLPHKPGILPLDETLRRQCRRCGAFFITKSRVRKRCDDCQAIVALEKQKKANARLKARRAAERAFARANRVANGAVKAARSAS